MTDIAYALDRLVPRAEYRGSLTANTREAYDALVWLDGRAKPAWSVVSTWTAPATNDDINAERDRRVAQGVQAGTTTGKTVNVDTRDDRDFRNIAGLVQQATLRTIAGDTTQMAFRGSDNVVTRLTPAEMLEIGAQVAAHVDAVYQASWAVKALINASPPLQKDDIAAAFDSALGL